MTAGRKKGQKTGPRKTASQGQLEARIQQVEDALTKRLSTRAVQTRFAAEWGVTARQVRDYIAEVFRTWRQDAQQLGEDDRAQRIARRDQQRASVSQACSLALDRKEVVRDGAGNPILDPASGKPLVRANPDLKTYIRGLELLSKLDGIDTPTMARIEHQHIGLPAPAPTVSIYAARSDDDLAYFLTHGHFPEDASKKKNGAANGTNGHAKA